MVDRFSPTAMDRKGPLVWHSLKGWSETYISFRIIYILLYNIMKIYNIFHFINLVTSN